MAFCSISQDLNVMKYSDASASPATINAHQSELACIALNQIGSRIATASEKVSALSLLQP